MSFIASLNNCSSFRLIFDILFKFSFESHLNATDKSGRTPLLEFAKVLFNIIKIKAPKHWFECQRLIGMNCNYWGLQRWCPIIEAQYLETKIGIFRFFGNAVKWDFLEWIFPHGDQHLKDGHKCFFMFSQLFFHSDLNCSFYAPLANQEKWSQSHLSTRQQNDAVFYSDFDDFVSWGQLGFGIESSSLDYYCGQPLI